MGKLSQLEIAHRLKPVAESLRPIRDRQLLDHLDRMLTEEGRVKASHISGFLPIASISGGLDPGDLPDGIDATLIGDGSVDDTTFAFLAGVTGPIQAQINVPVSIVPIRGNQSASDTANTTSTTTYQQAMTANVVLPAGTWTVALSGGASFTHSAGQGVDFYVEIAGAGALTPATNVSATNFLAAIDTAVATGQSGTVAIRVVFRSHNAGTTACLAPWFIGFAIRTA